jgi:hypothetical protein
MELRRELLAERGGDKHRAVDGSPAARVELLRRASSRKDVQAVDRRRAEERQFGVDEATAAVDRDERIKITARRQRAHNLTGYGARSRAPRRGASPCGTASAGAGVTSRSRRPPWMRSPAWVRVRPTCAHDDVLVSMPRTGGRLSNGVNVANNASSNAG